MNTESAPINPSPSKSTEKKWTKPVSALLALATTLGISLNTKKSEAENANINLNNTQLGEFITWSKYESGIATVEVMRYLNKIESDSFFIIRLPLKKGSNNDVYATDESNKRANYYLLSPPNNYNLIPQLIFNGKSNNAFSGNIDNQFESLISHTKENPQQQGKFSINEVEKNKKYEVEFTTTEKKLLNSNNYNLVVIAYQDWVNVNAENGERTYRNVFLESPLSPLGIGRKISKEGILSYSFNLNKITDQNRKQSGFVVFLQNKNVQDKNAKQIIATGLCRFAELDGIKEPAYFNWDNRPKSVIDYQKGTMASDEYLDLTGMKERSLFVNNLKDVKKIKFSIYKNNRDSNIYDILAGQLDKNLKEKAKFSFDPKNYEIIIEFNKPITSEKNTKIFSLYEHIKKDTPNLCYAHLISNISVEDDKGNQIYFTVNDIGYAYPNQGVSRQNKTDFDSDTWVGPKDEQIIMDEFGKFKGDNDWTSQTEKCDLNKDGRIDAADLAEFELAKDGRVDNYKRAKIVFETNPSSLPTEIQREIEKDLKKLQIESLRAQIDQAYQQMKAE